METSVRYLLMLDCIPPYPRKISVQQLREKILEHDTDLDISIRTLQRDLIKLSRYFPLVADESKPRGWSRIPEAPSSRDPQRSTPTLTRALDSLYLIARDHLPADYLKLLIPVVFAANKTGILSIDKDVLYSQEQTPLAA